MKLIILLLVFISTTFACSCASQSSELSFCKAHWVSHVKVNARMLKQPPPIGSKRKGLNQALYTVEHVKVYKSPANKSELDQEIYTPTERPACGIVLIPGKQYLLAGRVEGMGLFSARCGQILPDEAVHQEFENVLEWSAVPEGLPEILQAVNCSTVSDQ